MPTRQPISKAAPPRGFARSEFEDRWHKAQSLMAKRQLDALFVMTEPEVRYFTGFHSQFWQSPTRPWFVVLPLNGEPIAIIPEIGEAGMRETGIADIRCWPAPQPSDDGVSLLRDILTKLAGKHGRIGVPMADETQLRMPLLDFQSLSTSTDFVDATDIIKTLRGIKSESEIDKIRHACQLTSTAFEQLASKIQSTMSEREIVRTLQHSLLDEGADSCPYIVAGSGPGSYNNIIMGPTERALTHGDVLIIDTGTVYDGYFCDFDRNWAFGVVDDATHRAYDTVYAATEAGLAAARPGNTAEDLFNAMWAVLQKGGALGNNVGRLGHGLGMQLTEWPSNRAGDKTILKPGMVMTLEPGMEFAPGKMMVHEENLVIRDGEAEMLSRRAPQRMYEVD